MAVLNPNAIAAGGVNLDTDDDDDDDDDDNQLPARGFEKLICGDNTYDLRNEEDAEKALDDVSATRAAIQNGDLKEYEGRSTEPGEGGRARAWYDQIRAQEAVDFHDGKHTMSWAQQHDEAQRIIQQNAQQFRAQQLNQQSASK
jgi:hypothetical protein